MQVLCICFVLPLARLLRHSPDLWNVYARRYGEATAYSSGAPAIEGDTFDECGGHASSTTQSSYHVHVPPTCLLKQLNADNSQHSPQIGWSLDGFPICAQHDSIGAFFPNISRLDCVCSLFVFGFALQMVHEETVA
eukprot:SAG31_NODE_7828_length_1588_cov_1.454668_2_plen_136_part_00